MGTYRRGWLVLVSGLLIGVMFASSADAQRKRRGRKGKRPATQQVVEPAPTQEPAVAPAASENEPPIAEGDAAVDATAAPAPDAEPATPAAEPPPAPQPEVSEVPAVDLEPLRAELAEVMDELVQARARVAILGKTLFKTRVRVTIQNLTGDTQRVGRIALKLDGAPIFSGGPQALKGDEESQVFEGFAAPGPHTLVLEVEQIGRDDEEYRYGLRESYRFQLPKERSTELRLVLDDDSDMAEDFDEDEEGEYDVRTRLKVRAHPIGED